MSFRRMSLVLALSLFGGTACSHSNNLLLGEVRAKLGSHDVRVTDCYRTTVPQPSLTPNRQVWQPCRDADITIELEQLTVNGKDYGKLNAGDSVLVDHGVVSISRSTATTPSAELR